MTLEIRKAIPTVDVVRYTGSNAQDIVDWYNSHNSGAVLNVEAGGAALITMPGGDQKTLTAGEWVWPSLVGFSQDDFDAGYKLWTPATEPPVLPPPGIFQNYTSLGYATRPYASGLAVPQSTGAVGSSTHKRITIPWDTEYADPENQHSMPAGWTILYGPAHYGFTAYVMLQGGTEDASMHISTYEAEVDPVTNEETLTYRQAAEWFVGKGETHVNNGVTTYSNTHLFGRWDGYLAAGRRLRIMVDNWGPSPARVVSAAVTGFWGRPA